MLKSLKYVSLLIFCLMILTSCLLAISFNHNSKYMIKNAMYGVLHVSAPRIVGAGFIIGENIILTVSHVVHGADSLNIQAYDKKIYKAHIVFEDTSNDLAVLSFDDWEGFKKNSKYTIIPLVPDYELLDHVYSVGNPSDISFTVTAGIVSSRTQSLSHLSFLIETDAGIFEGSSGGPLLNDHGEAIGINEALLPMEGGSMGMATPYELIMRFLDDQKLFHETRRTNIGVDIRPDGTVVKIAEGGPSQIALLKLGDIVYAPGDNSRVFESNTERGLYISTRPSYESFSLDIIRDGKHITIMIKPNYVVLRNETIFKAPKQ